MGYDDMNDDEARRDPAGAPKSHPVGVGVGAAAGGIAAGAAVGSVAGPIGTAVGAVAGAVAGALAGRAIAENYDPAVEEEYWRGRYEAEPYFDRGHTFDDYAPAYRLGGLSRRRYPDGRFEEVEQSLALEYEAGRGQSRLDWERARPAVIAAWDRGTV